MRLAIDARKLHDFGIGTYVRNLVTGLARLDHDHEYTLIVHPDDAGFVRALGPNFTPALDAAGKIVYVDPAQGSYDNRPPADLILITDIHGDHMVPAVVEKLMKTTEVSAGGAEKDLGAIASALLKDSVAAPRQPVIKVNPTKGGSGTDLWEGIPGRQLIDETWVAAMTKPAFSPSQTGRPVGYGFQTWTIPGQKPTFGLFGVRGQLILVEPTRQLVMVHTAVRTDARDSGGAFIGNVAAFDAA